MRSLRIICLSMLVWFCQAPSLPPPQFNIPLARPSYGMMFNAVHIAATCIVSYLLLRTLQELKQIKTNIAQEKAKITKEKSYVTHSYLENEVNEGIEIKLGTVASQAGRFFTPAGEGRTIKEQLQEYYNDLIKLENRVKTLEQKSEKT